MQLTATVRTPTSESLPAEIIAARKLEPDTRWHDLLDSVDTVVHTAARVHVVRESNGLDDYRRVNVEGTLNLARQAAQCGVRRFVFLSSVKVNGEFTSSGHAFSAHDDPAPADAYGKSKLEAERELSRLVQTQGMEVVIVRPPLVYGPGVKANFLALMRWVHKGLPLPFGGVNNARSLIALDNLTDLIWTCCVHPRAANETVMAADGEDISTTELITRLGVTLNMPARLITVPRGLLRIVAAAAGRSSQLDKLLRNLQVDISKTRELLDWKPVVTMEQTLQAVARHFMERQQ